MLPKKLLLGSALCLLLGACASVKLSIVNETGGPIRAVDVKTEPQGWILPLLEDGATDTRVLKLEKKTGIAITYLNSQGQQFFTSAALSLDKGDTGEVTLGLTPQGTVRVDDKRKK